MMNPLPYTYLEESTRVGGKKTQFTKRTNYKIYRYSNDTYQLDTENWNVILLLHLIITLHFTLSGATYLLIRQNQN
jgi:hypothetical protein